MAIRKASHPSTAPASTDKVQRYVRSLHYRNPTGIPYQLDGIRAAVVKLGAPETVVMIIYRRHQQQSFESKQINETQGTNRSSQKQPPALPPQFPAQVTGPVGGGGDGDGDGEGVPLRHCASTEREIRKHTHTHTHTHIYMHLPLVAGVAC